MSRTYRLRHLPQPEGGRSARLFVDSNLRNPRDRAEEAFIAQLAHVELKLPCKLHEQPPHPYLRRLTRSHEYCLPRELRDYLWTLRLGSPYWNLGFARTMNIFSHPLIGYGLAIVPSDAKKFGRKQAYRTHRRASKRLLRLVATFRYLDRGTCLCGEPGCDMGVPEFKWAHGTEIDPDEDRMDFDRTSIKRGLADSSWRLTW